MTNTASPQTSTAALPTPPNIAGYRILKPIGAGGMSAVFLAEQISLGRKVAIKVMSPQVAHSPEACDRFVREARAAAAVNHPNVVSIIDVGQANSQLYMVLELVTGGDAAQLAEQQGGILSEERALQIMIDCCKGLEALHEANLVHRDLKPSNIFLAHDGTAKVGDLGLARSADGADRMTVTGHLIGTPAFMSPEQAGGEKLDIRSDIYSLGATLFALVTGRQPFVANTPIAVAAKAMVEPAPNPRSINPRLSPLTGELILRCIAKNSNDRFQSPRVLRSALEGLLANIRPIEASAVTSPESAKLSHVGSPPQKTFPMVSVIGLLVSIGILIAALTWYFDARPSRSPFPKPENSDVLTSAPTLSDLTSTTANSSNLEPSQWVTAHNQDGFGLWRDLTFKQARQRLRWIPPGTFTVGSPTSEIGHRGQESLSTVTFSFGVWMADTECSQALWEAVMGSNPSSSKDPRQPITDINIHAAIEFTHRLGLQCGNIRVRLPSRAEWERACRANSKTVYSTGDDPESLEGYANLNDFDRHRAIHSRKLLSFSDGFVAVAPVASLKPNRLGLFDMHGNVFEFCLAGTWAALPERCTDPFIDDSTSWEISFLRGGSFSSEDTINTRCAALPYVDRISSGPDIGFRFLIEDRH